MPRALQSLVAAAIVSALGILACLAPRSPSVARQIVNRETVLTLAGQFSIPPLTKLPEGARLQFGGISGLAPTGAPGEFLAVSDDRTAHRYYRLRITGEGPSFRVDVVEAIPLDDRVRGPRLDPEAIVIMENGDLLISSEGRGAQQTRVPPSIARYSRQGTFVGELPIRDRFVPNDGPPPRGVRANAGFESLTLAPGGRRLYSATETALLQDGDPVTFDHGTMSRMLEYIREGDTFVPRREFAYPLDAMDAAPFTADASAAGIVELLALSDDELLALERTFISAAAGQGRGINHIRLYHVSVADASDISAIDSLRGLDLDRAQEPAGQPVARPTPSARARPERIRPARKTLLLDLAALQGLSPDLTTLDNFEGLAFGPLLADGSRSLVIVSDDNFNQAQRTWFLLLRISGR